ncbi:hypothetical protein H4Q26_003423 [Puccinia striiformis f. sp. tritici PST-130]|nr:hypothetical protein H4Q26_003423 [Puccinia striiformis f. sp. tritici PST-130]
MPPTAVNKSRRPLSIAIITNKLTPVNQSFCQFPLLISAEYVNSFVSSLALRESRSPYGIRFIRFATSLFKASRGNPADATASHFPQMEEDSWSFAELGYILVAGASGFFSERDLSQPSFTTCGVRSWLYQPAQRGKAMTTIEVIHREDSQSGESPRRFGHAYAALILDR